MRQAERTLFVAERNAAPLAAPLVAGNEWSTTPMEGVDGHTLESHFFDFKTSSKNPNLNVLIHFRTSSTVIVSEIQNIHSSTVFHIFDRFLSG